MFALTATETNEPDPPSELEEMKMAHATNIHLGQLSLADRAAALVAAIREAVQRRRVYRQTLRELGALSTRELNDLGISRSMITRIALEAAQGK